MLAVACLIPGMRIQSRMDASTYRRWLNHTLLLMASSCWSRSAWPGPARHRQDPGSTPAGAPLEWRAARGAHFQGHPSPKRIQGRPPAMPAPHARPMRRSDPCPPLTWCPGMQLRFASVLLLFLAGCTALVRHDLDQRFGPADGGRYDAPRPGAISFRWQVILDSRCVVCHSCPRDAPCQIKRWAPQGVARGGSKIEVYNGTRLREDADPPFHRCRESLPVADKGFRDPQRAGRQVLRL